MLVGLLLMMHESPFPLQAMLRSESLARWIQRSFQTTLPAGGRGSIGSAVLGAVTKLRHRRMLATLEGKQLRTSSWASYRVWEVAAVSTGNRSNLPHPGLWAQTGVEKVKRKQLQRTGPQVFAPSQSSGFQVFILCADVCLHPLIPARSGFCLCQLSLLGFGFVSYVLRQDIALIAKKQFVFFACIFGDGVAD